MGLAERLEALGRQLGQREAAFVEELQVARARAEELRAEVAEALGRFHVAAENAGAVHLSLEISAVRVDDKHVRSCEFELIRGRHRAIVTVKSRGEVTLVGPFQAGKEEGPCCSFPLVPSDEFASAFEGFLASFVEDASTP